jgi:23S rRNA (adenine2503-C2)-methyltransferase
MRLAGLTVRALEELLESRTRAIAAAKWIYGPRPWSEALPAAVDGLGAAAWSKLRTTCESSDVRISGRSTATDGTIKLVMAVDGGAVESVMIPTPRRSTICVSSQIGCTRSCTFCATATLGFRRNLRADEIVAQFLIARSVAPASAPAKNVVFMGMGEPMDNLDEVLTAVEILTQSPAPQLGHAQVTVSTSGVLPGMKRFLAESKCSLALSLNGTTDAQRVAVMPQTKSWPIDALLALLRAHPDRVHFIEYVMFDGINDSDDDAVRIIELLRGVNARLNLIPHNAIAESPLRASPRDRIEGFRRVTVAAGVRTMIRWPRGSDIAAACGQLVGRNENQRLLR